MQRANNLKIDRKQFNTIVHEKYPPYLNEDQLQRLYGTFSAVSWPFPIHPFAETVNPETCDATS